MCNLIFRRGLFCFLLYVSLIARPVSAQKSDGAFPAHAAYVSEALDISWKMPRGFHEVQRGDNDWWTPVERKKIGNAGFIYELMLQSKDKDCVILYPRMELLLIFFNAKDSTFAQRTLVAEMNAALKQNGMKPQVRDVSGLDEYVTVYQGEKAENSLNADTVYIADIPLQTPFHGNYTYCTGIYVVKKGRPSMLLKCFFTEDGEKKKDKYLRKLFRSVKYRNEDWKYDDEKCLRESYKLYLKGRG